MQQLTVCRNQQVEEDDHDNFPSCEGGPSRKWLHATGCLEKSTIAQVPSEYGSYRYTTALSAAQQQGTELGSALCETAKNLLHAIMRTCAGQDLVLVVRLALLVGGLLHVQQRSAGHLAGLEAALGRSVACNTSHRTSPAVSCHTQTGILQDCEPLSAEPDAATEFYVATFVGIYSAPRDSWNSMRW